MTTCKELYIGRYQQALPVYNWESAGETKEEHRKIRPLSLLHRTLQAASGLAMLSAFFI